jgi:hypothetical protein
MMRELYAPNYAQRREEAILRAAGRCEKIIDGQRCPNRVGTLKISHAHNLYFEQLYVHHVNDDPENEDAELICYCASCHMKAHRQPVAGGKATARKQGYRVVRIEQLLCSLAAVGFSARYNEECRVNWQLGPFVGEAADMLDAVTMCLHWLSAEVRDLQEALARTQVENRRLIDSVVRTQQAEERRQCDTALQAIGCR